MLRGANFSLTHFAIRLDLAGLFIENKKAQFITLRTFTSWFAWDFCWHSALFFSVGMYGVSEELRRPFV